MKMQCTEGTEVGEIARRATDGGGAGRVHGCQIHRREIRRLAVIAALVLSCQGAAATDKVGRTSITLPDGWSVLTRYESKLSFNGGEYSIPLYTVVYQLAGPGDTPRALLMVASTEGGNRGRVRWVSETCPDARPKYFTNDYDTRAVTHTRECLIVNAAFVPGRFFKPDAEVPNALKAQGLKFFRNGYSLRAVYGIQNGSLLRVHLMTDRSFVGLAGGAAAAGDLHDVPAPLVAWGEALRASVSRSVLSLGGQLQLPPVSFTR